jgi:hypothetical protein
LIPRLVAAAAIIVGGLWLGQYLGRSTLVWAVNEDLPAPRRIAVGVRTLVIFAAVVVAADTIDFAASVFLAGFVLILGGLVLAAALAFGLGARDVVKQRLAGKFAEESEEVHERSLWHHL